MIPRATYRLQFRNGMDFKRAIATLPYLHRLGISHLYASPLFAAVSGSTHGYDVIDNNLVEPSLGGMAGLIELSDTLKSLGMGLILDIVPNHMAASLQNRWWYDIVQWGQLSAYAGYFDVDWRRKLTLPLLGSDVAAALAAGELSLRYDARNCSLAIAYFDNFIPLNPESYAEALAPIDGLAVADLSAHAAKATPSSGDWKEALRTLWAHGVPPEIDHKLADVSRDLAHIDRIYRLQPWCLIGWRDAARSLSYRRFFEIAGLVGLRVEDKAVFEEVHRLTLQLVQGNIVQGLRVDHVDGLADPGAYLRRLRAAVGPACYIIVEKILAKNECLSQEWPIQGTTGYEFTSAMMQALVDKDGADALTRFYLSHRSPNDDLEAERRKAKLTIVRKNFAGELNRLVETALRADGGFAAEDIENLFVEIIAAFPVYRTYGDERGMGQPDRHLLANVAEKVRVAGRNVDEAALRWLTEVLTAPSGETLAETLRRFQQLTSAVMAKAVEDTLFYRWHALIGLNEVGGDPALQPVPVSAWHEIMRHRLKSQPNGLLATATHDTKHGEDARARLYALSERPADWISAVERWRRIGRETAPSVDPELESLFYQSLASIWPAGPVDPKASLALRERMVPFLEKALREAKLHTSWTNVDAGYEQAFIGFATRLLHEDNRRFWDDFSAAVQPFVLAGWINSIAQTLIKLTAPGVPDIYQGSELADFSLVDPDNRRPVDFAASAQALKRPLSIIDRSSLSNGRMKQRLIAAALALRRANSELFVSGSYEPLRLVGERPQNAIAFLRRTQSAAMVVITPCRSFGDWWPSCSEAFWQDTHVILPPGLACPLFDVLSGTAVPLSEGILLAKRFATWPVSFLVGPERPTYP